MKPSKKDSEFSSLLGGSYEVQVLASSRVVIDFQLPYFWLAQVLGRAEVYQHNLLHFFVEKHILWL